MMLILVDGAPKALLVPDTLKRSVDDSFRLVHGCHDVQGMWAVFTLSTPVPKLHLQFAKFRRKSIESQHESEPESESQFAS